MSGILEYGVTIVEVNNKTIPFAKGSVLAGLQALDTTSHGHIS